MANSVTQTYKDLVGGAHRDIYVLQRHLKQESVHMLLMEEYGVSKKWVMIMDRRQDSRDRRQETGLKRQDSGLKRQDLGLKR